MRWFLIAAVAVVVAWTGVLAAAVVLGPAPSGAAETAGQVGPERADVALPETAAELTEDVPPELLPEPMPEPMPEPLPEPAPERSAASAAIETPPVAETPAPRAPPPAAETAPPPPRADPPAEQSPPQARQPPPVIAEPVIAGPPPAEPAPRYEVIPDAFLRMPVIDRAAFTPSAYASEILPALQAGAAGEIRIEAHTDGAGDREMNRALSQDWANAMRDWLASQGVDPEVIVSATGYGGDRPLEVAGDGVPSFLSQRIELRIVYRQGIIRYLDEDE